MAGPLRYHDRLDALASDIRRLRREIIEREREAGELLDGEIQAGLASDRVVATRLLLEAAKGLYFDENEARRGLECPIHGEGIVVSCPDCVGRHPQLRPNYEAYLAAVRASDQAAE